MLRIESVRNVGLRPDLSPIFKTRGKLPLGTPLLLDMAKDARILCDPERCLAETLERLRGRLQKLVATRAWIGNDCYWKLKSDYS